MISGAFVCENLAVFSGVLLIIVGPNLVHPVFCMESYKVIRKAWWSSYTRRHGVLFPEFAAHFNKYINYIYYRFLCHHIECRNL